MIHALCFGICIIFMVGLGFNPLVNALLWYCDSREQTDTGPRMEFVLLSLLPFCWLTAIVELYCVYVQPHR